MTRTHFPFGYWPLRHLPGWHWAHLSHGHLAYRGVGGLSRVDFSMPVGLAQADATSIALRGLSHAAGARYTYAARPVAGNAWLQTPDVSCACEFETDAEGRWIGNRPAAVEWTEAKVLSGGRIAVHWSYRTPHGQAPPVDFAVYHAATPSVVRGSPQAAVNYAGDGEYSCTFALADGRTYWFAVAARTAGDVESRLSRLVGPRLADASLPASPTVSVSTTFEAR